MDRNWEAELEEAMIQVDTVKMDVGNRIRDRGCFWPSGSWVWFPLMVLVRELLAITVGVSGSLACVPFRQILIPLANLEVAAVPGAMKRDRFE